MRQVQAQQRQCKEEQQQAAAAAQEEEEAAAAEEEEEDKCLSITGTTRRWSDAYMSRLNDTVLGSSWSLFFWGGSSW